MFGNGNSQYCFWCFPSKIIKCVKMGRWFSKIHHIMWCDALLSAHHFNWDHTRTVSPIHALRWTQRHQSPSHNLIVPTRFLIHTKMNTVCTVIMNYSMKEKDRRKLKLWITLPVNFTLTTLPCINTTRFFFFDKK